MVNIGEKIGEKFEMYNPNLNFLIDNFTKEESKLEESDDEDDHLEDLMEGDSDSDEDDLVKVIKAKPLSLIETENSVLVSIVIFFFVIPTRGRVMIKKM